MTSLGQWCEQHGADTGVAPLYIAITESACELRDILNATFPPLPAESAAADCTDQATSHPVLAAVQQARESARVAECDLRLALKATGGRGAEYMVLYPLIPEATRVYQKLAELAAQLEDAAQ